MATVIAVSSFVARGTVGLRAILPSLDRMGHEAIACPTTLLSNHLGHARATGSPVAPETLSAIIEALDANGWLPDVDAVLTGYLPSPDHVRIVETLVARLHTQRPDALFVCDPVLGDHPGGLYVPQGVAEAVRDRLLPRATHVKPNRFELAFLSGRPVETPADVVDAARALPVPVVLASSIPLDGNRLGNIVVTRDRAVHCTVPRESRAPHGTGDLLAALFTAHLLHGEDPATSAAFAAGAVARTIALSAGEDELQLWGPTAWHEAPPLAMTSVESTND
ncbi:pyridoxal kinase [Hyphomicrobium sp.]|uniref:pyridoxal kinase n=1 Tax=Hyphomicrobium sp. TaxID=82 RepID=UPI0025B9DDA3|nr:pyridoxal kinase [Hyphomicrobium sp.]MCC7253332.1 pyridoxal kinase [Hyphomicrobium sp.]